MISARLKMPPGWRGANFRNFRNLACQIVNIDQNLICEEFTSYGPIRGAFVCPSLFVSKEFYGTNNKLFPREAINTVGNKYPEETGVCCRLWAAPSSTCDMKGGFMEVSAWRSYRAVWLFGLNKLLEVPPLSPVYQNLSEL